MTQRLTDSQIHGSVNRFQIQLLSDSLVINGCVQEGCVKPMVIIEGGKSMIEKQACYCPSAISDLTVSTFNRTSPLFMLETNSVLVLFPRCTVCVRGRPSFKEGNEFESNKLHSDSEGWDDSQKFIHRLFCGRGRN